MLTTVELLKGLELYPKWVERAIVVLYKRQTAAERISGTTRVHNGRGFNAVDAGMGSYMAKWILGGNHLNDKWLAKARKMLPKYTRQLLEIAAERAAQPKENHEEPQES